ncbi:unnamed protein product [Cyprideis torosa]|uniref:Uncharacterized protein n=1 Tax=Cyprideis torosa TaxID=163714 RepID=A0A7R8WEB2_9CRUS|nr:unnamed protein product [Cyprideis torosa]CAG0889573.1 unnamed protein product [Cyprideis torosa]
MSSAKDSSEVMQGSAGENVALVSVSHAETNGAVAAVSTTPVDAEELMAGAAESTCTAVMDTSEATGACSSSEKPRRTKKPKQCLNQRCPGTSNRFHRADDIDKLMLKIDPEGNKRKFLCSDCHKEARALGVPYIERIMSGKMTLDHVPDVFPTVELDDASTEESDPECYSSDTEFINSCDPQTLQLVYDRWKTKMNVAELTEKYNNMLQSVMDKQQPFFDSIDDTIKSQQKQIDVLRKNIYDGYGYNYERQPELIIEDDPNGEIVKVLQARPIPDDDDSDEVEVIDDSRVLRPRPVKPKKKASTHPNPELEKAVQAGDSVPVEEPVKSVRRPPPVLRPGLINNPNPPDPLKAGDQVYVKVHEDNSMQWVLARITPSSNKTQAGIPIFSVVTENRTNYILPASKVAYGKPELNWQISVGKRIVSPWRDGDDGSVLKVYSGTIAESPRMANKYRYLVFFDDGYAFYSTEVHLIAQQSKRVWEDVPPMLQEFVKNYIDRYPERDLVRVPINASLKVERKGNWYNTKVIDLDASLVKVKFPDVEEWIYRGSTRLAPLYNEMQRKLRMNPPTSVRSRPRHNVRQAAQRPGTAPTEDSPIVVSDHALKHRGFSQEQPVSSPTKNQQLARTTSSGPSVTRSIAKKSTGGSVKKFTGGTATKVPSKEIEEEVIHRDGRVVNTGIEFMGTLDAQETLAAVKSNMKIQRRNFYPHSCNPECAKETFDMIDSLVKTINCLAVPICLGWDRGKLEPCSNNIKGVSPVIIYRASCGRVLRGIDELTRFLRVTESKISIDMFSFELSIDVWKIFKPKVIQYKQTDMTHGIEKVPISCVNSLNSDTPEQPQYSAVRTPMAGVKINTDPDFLVCCDCKDDCIDKSNCACQKLTSESAVAINDSPDVGYTYRRLYEQLRSGLYECNSRCACNRAKERCMNRVVQFPFNWKLQLFKTEKKGWGLRCLHDLPAGSFICTYAGQLLGDPQAEEEGMVYGDEYFAELDFIEILEKAKEGYESDVEDTSDQSSVEKSSNESEGETTGVTNRRRGSSSYEKDEEFRRQVMAPSTRCETRSSSRRKQRSVGRKSLGGGGGSSHAGTARKGSKGSSSQPSKKSTSLRQNSSDEKKKPNKGDDDCSDFRKLLEDNNEKIMYIMDAKVKGNIGRYLNHSCDPNVFVQNVFVDTHDLRFPWVAFFASENIKAGEELTWNYHYVVDSVAGKCVDCHCNTKLCRGRML